MFRGLNESGKDFAVGHVFIVSSARVGIQSQPVKQLVKFIANALRCKYSY
jgi:hypothetical protein